MYQDINTYKPFEHEDSDSKNKIINYGRLQDKTRVEGAFTATLIYTNLVDYLARHLLEHLNKMTTILMFRQFGGVVYYDLSKKKTNLSLGSLCQELSYYEFPSRSDFLKDLQDFNRLRNQAIHNLMKLNLNAPSNQFDADLSRISGLAEEILTKYNTITAGIIAIWNTANNVGSNNN